MSYIEPVDHSRYLLGDFHGRLLMLFLEFSEEMESGITNIANMKLEVLGEVCPCIILVGYMILVVHDTSGSCIINGVHSSLLYYYVLLLSG